MLIALLVGSMLQAGSVFKINFASDEILSKAVKDAQDVYEKHHGDKFKRSSYAPHVTLLFLSAENDDSKLIKVDTSNTARAAQLNFRCWY